MGAWEQERKHERKRALEHKSSYKRKKKIMCDKIYVEPSPNLGGKKNINENIRHYKEKCHKSNNVSKRESMRVREHESIKTQ